MKYGNWTLLDEAENVKGSDRILCRCDCGTERRVIFRNLKEGRSTNCGCVRKEKVGNRNRTHSLSKCHDLYNTWKLMRTRCNNPQSRSYANYGGRGIKVCKRWNDFVNFVADMGDRPIGGTIDRIDNDGDYEPGNCRWATQAEQALNTRRNRRITCCGRTLTISQWAEEIGISYGALRLRLEHGWNVEEALAMPAMSHEQKRTKHHRMLTFDGRTQPLAVWAKEIGISKQALTYRLKKGWSTERAFSLPKRFKELAD